MPVISFSEGDYLRSKILEGDQWLSWEIKDVTAPRKNDAGDGFNWDVTFALIDYSNAEVNGKEVKRTFSSKALGFALDLAYAVEGVRKNEVTKEIFQSKFSSYDFDNVKGKKIDGKVKVEIYQGNPNNKVEEYAPYKSVAGKGPVF